MEDALRDEAVEDVADISDQAERIPTLGKERERGQCDKERFQV